MFTTDGIHAAEMAHIDRYECTPCKIDVLPRMLAALVLAAGRKCRRRTDAMICFLNVARVKSISNTIMVRPNVRVSGYSPIYCILHRRIWTMRYCSCYVLSLLSERIRMWPQVTRRLNDSIQLFYLHSKLHGSKAQPSEIYGPSSTRSTALMRSAWQST